MKYREAERSSEIQMGWEAVLVSLMVASGASNTSKLEICASFKIRI